MRISDWSSDVCSSDLLGAAVDIFEQRRFEHGPLALAADEQRRTVRYRLLNPAIEPRGFLLGDHRADEGLAILGIARDQRLRLFDQHVAEPVVDVGVDDDTLHPAARLDRESIV